MRIVAGYIPQHSPRPPAVLSGRWGCLPRHSSGRWLVELPEEVPEPALRDLLRYAHGDNGGLAWLPAMAWEHIGRLLECQDFFLMPELVDHCQEYLIRQLRPSNVVAIWDLAVRFRLEVCCRDPPPPPRDALQGKGPQRRPQRRLGRRLEEVAEAVGGGCCRLQMPLKLALAVRGTVAGQRLEGVGGTSPPSDAPPPPPDTC